MNKKRLRDSISRYQLRRTADLNKIRHIGVLNLALLLIATAAPIGNVIDLPPPISIWSRCLVAFFALGALIVFTKVSIKFDYKKQLGSFILCAALQAFHWITYFYALRLAGAGLGLISLFTFPVFTSLLEPLILRTKFDPKHILLGMLVLFGLYVLTPELSFQNSTTTGVMFGVLSAVFYSIRNILMKKHVATYDASMLMFYQTGLIVILLAPVFFLYDWTWPQYGEAIPMLIFLGVVTTATGHTLLVKSFAHFSATAAALLSCVQPLYGVLIAYFYPGEIPTLSTIIGGCIIVSAVALEALLSKKETT